MILQRDITYLKGVGEKRASLLKKELNIHTFNDLLHYFPFKYIDRTQFYTLDKVHSKLPYIQVKGKITGFRSEGERHKKRLIATFTDGTDTIELVWFKGLKWIQQNLQRGKEYVVFGKPSEFKRDINIVHPEMEEIEKWNEKIQASLEAAYHTTEKLKNSFLTSKAIHKLMQNLFKTLSATTAGKKELGRERLPDYIIERFRLISRKDALFNIHFPQSSNLLHEAGRRLKFEELFYIQLKILHKKISHNIRFKGFVFSKIGNYFNTFYKENLPFTLTGAQKRVLKEIRKNLATGNQMNRLLQGDVGSGKTLVALMTMLMALDNGYQTCLMAPTELLAQQHYATLAGFLKDMDVSLRLLTGSTRKKQRRILHDELQNGTLNIIVGTHALIEDTVQFKNLGLVIIDEQHRFGVAQRAKLWKKNTIPPHVLVMTATPIPRTLAMTVYGDLDVSVIDELPPGRKPIKTVHRYDSQRLKVFGFIRKQIDAGFQVYIVYPLIKESEALDYKDLQDGYQSITKAFPPPEYAVSMVHGQMQPEEKEKAMNLFVRGITQIMVATTVIEVGVDVPNATLMLIESAERFGLSQLHQLRGRVGRGGNQSYCILMTSYKLSTDARKRLETIVRSTDGFEIAEADMRLRGPGDLDGTQQSGVPIHLKIANLAKDNKLLHIARSMAYEILQNDNMLKEEKNRILREQLSKNGTNEVSWDVIS